MVDDIRDKRPSRSDEPEIIEPAFTPPEKMADDEVVIDLGGEPAAPTAKQAAANKTAKQPNKLTAKLKTLARDIAFWWGKRSKKQKIAMIIGLVIGLAVAGFGIYTLVKPEPTKPAPVAEKKEEPKEPPKPTTEPSRLTGVVVPIELNQLPVTGVMIENSPDARPQAGLKDAGVVFEAIAEGGITRFLALYLEAQPDHIGPVRSVRPYYLSWLQGFDAPIAHAGGSGEALAKIRNERIKDIDHGANGSTYRRVNNRFAPHNLYTSRANLLAAGNGRGYTSSVFTGFARKAEKPANPVTAKGIDLRISSGLYNVHYDYDAASNSYLRTMGGRPHVDERSGAQLAPKVVIALVIPYRTSGIYSVYGTIGNGKAYIFQDGEVIDGTWSKGSDKDQIRFGDANGAPIGLNPGQTWISAVGNATSVGFAP